MDKAEIARQYQLAEQKIIHLMLKDHRAVDDIIASGYGPDLFADHHQPIVSAIFEEHADGRLLTADNYRMRLAMEMKQVKCGDGKTRTIDLPLSMDVFARCDLKAYAVMDDLGILKKQLIDGYIARQVVEGLHEYRERSGSDGHLKSASRLAEVTQRAVSKVSQVGNIEFLGLEELNQVNDGVDWIWQNFIARGNISLISGLPKSGKTTLNANVISKMKDGGYLAGEIHPTRVLYVTEDAKRIWKARVTDLGINGNLELVFVRDQRRGLIDSLVARVRRGDIDLVVIDPIANFLGIEDENDSAKMIQALLPLKRLQAEDVGILLCHHPRKSGGDYGMSARGSGALTGFVDVVIDFDRPVGASGADDRRRVLKVYSRIDMCFETHLELADEGYVEITPENRSQMNRKKKRSELLDLLGGETLTARELSERSDGKYSERRIREMADLAGLDIEKLGSGSKNDPFRYRKHIW